MTVDARDYNRLLTVGVEEHAHIVDAFIASGRDPLTIAIRQGIDPEMVMLILRAYNFHLGAEYGDAEDDRRQFRRVPEKVVKNYVREYYPGFLEGRPEAEMTLLRYLYDGPAGRGRK
ncbi:MAG: hypothetical protein ACOX41_09975 [Anaerovoracaceae bacterium]